MERYGKVWKGMKSSRETVSARSRSCRVFPATRLCNQTLLKSAYLGSTRCFGLEFGAQALHSSTDSTATSVSQLRHKPPIYATTSSIAGTGLSAESQNAFESTMQLKHAETRPSPKFAPHQILAECFRWHQSSQPLRGGAVKYSCTMTYRGMGEILQLRSDASADDTCAASEGSGDALPKPQQVIARCSLLALGTKYSFLDSKPSFSLNSP